MKNLTKELFDNTESQCLIADHYNQTMTSITEKVIREMYKTFPEIRESFNTLEQEEAKLINRVYEDAIQTACNESLLIGFKAGFNTAQEIHGSECLI